MLNLIKIVVLSAFLMGCASTQQKYVTQVETITVFKPVYTPPDSIKKMEIIPRPDLKSNHLTEQDKSDPGKVAKIIIESEAQLRIYAEQLENQIDVLMHIYNRPADPIPPSIREVKTINTK